MKKLLAVLITWMALMAPLPAQELERIGEWGTPPYHHFEVTGTTLYALSENGWLDVFDIADPAMPVRGMRLRLEGTPKQLLIDGHRAYISSGWGGIIVLDITDPGTPVMTNRVDIGSDVRHLSLNGTTAYLCSRGNGIGIVDVTDPDHPTLVELQTEFAIEGELEEIFFDTIVSLVNSSTLFVSDSSGELIALDITDPREPTYVGHFSAGADINAMIIEGDLLIAGSGISGVSTFNVADLTAMVRLDSFSSLSVDLDDDGYTDYTYRIDYAYRLVLRGDALYVADGSGFDVLDISNTSDILVHHDYEAPFWTTDIAIVGDMLFTAETVNGLGVFDITTVDESPEIARINDSGYTLDMVVTGDRMITADLYRGIRVLDISDRANPFSAGTINSEGLDVAAAVAGDHLYVANSYQGVMVYDITDMDTPEQIAAVTSIGVPQDLIVSGDTMLVPGEWGGMSVFSLTDPALPELTGTYSAAGYVYDADVSGDTVALAAGFAGMELVSIADPQTPTRISNLDTAGIVTDVLMDGTIVYLADFFAGLYIVDISSPQHPILMNHLPEYYGSEHLTLLDGMLYVLRGSSGLDRLNVSDPANPAFVDRIETEGTVRNIQSHDGYLYISDGASGRILIYRMEDPAPVAVPHVPAGNGWSSDLAFSNPNDTDATAMVTIYRHATPAFSMPIHLPAGETVFVPLSTDGCARISRMPEGVEVHQRITATADNRFVEIPLGLPFVNSGELILETDTSWTGIALMNNENSSREFHLLAFDAAGTQLADTVVQLGPVYRNAWILDSLFPDVETGRIARVMIQSQAAFAALAIWENQDGVLKATVPTP